MSAVLNSAQLFKQRLIKRNDKAVKQMIRSYARAWKRLKPEFDRLVKQITVARAAGEEISPAWIARLTRYQQLMLQLYFEMNKLAEQATNITIEQEKAALYAGFKDSQALMQQSLGPVPREVIRAGYSISWNRVPENALQNIVGVLQDGSPLSYKFAGLAPQVAEGIKDAIAQGIALGWNPKKTAAAIKKEYDTALYNSVLTCRTETLRAYRTASHENYRANSDVVQGWIWACAHSARTCSACWAMDGTFHTLDEVLEDHPAGRCVPIPSCKSWSELFPNLDLKGIKETSTQPWSSEDTFSELSDKDKLAVLGPTVFKLFQSGKLKLSDVAQKVSSDTWGDHYQPKSLKKLIRERVVSRKDVLEAQQATRVGRKHKQAA